MTELNVDPQYLIEYFRTIHDVRIGPYIADRIIHEFRNLPEDQMFSVDGRSLSLGVIISVGLSVAELRKVLSNAPTPYTGNRDPEGDREANTCSQLGYTRQDGTYCRYGEIRDDPLTIGLIEHIRAKYDLLIGVRMAERTIWNVVSGQATEVILRGRDLVSGWPKAIALTAEEVRAVLAQVGNNSE